MIDYFTTKDKEKAYCLGHGLFGSSISIYERDHEHDNNEFEGYKRIDFLVFETIEQAKEEYMKLKEQYEKD